MMRRVVLLLLTFATVVLNAAVASAQLCGVPDKPDCPKPSVRPTVRTESKAEAAERRRREEARRVARLVEKKRREDISRPPTVIGGTQSKAHLERGIDYLNNSEYVQAFASLSKAITANPNSPKAYYSRGLANVGLRKIDAAVADYTAAIGIDDKYTEAYNNRGTLLFMEKMDPLAAIKDYSVAITLFPFDIDLPTIYTNRGRAYQFTENFEAAIADFSKAIEGDTAYTKAYLHRGIIYLEMKKYAAAVADFDMILSMNPLNADADKYKKKALKDENDYKAKIEKLKTTAQAGSTSGSPSNADDYYYLGNAYRDGNDPDNAILNYDRALAIKPDFKFAYLNRGNAYLMKKNYDDALRDFTDVINRDQAYAAAYRYRGLAYFGKGDYDAAINEYSETLMRDAKIVDAYFKRALAYMEKKTRETDEAALRDLTEYIAKNPTFPATYRIRADVYDRLSESAPLENRQKLKDDAERDRMTAKDRYQR
ncbi:MAG: tetratricopeptide repeat protein [Pyrinomonadaceae bacterium]